MENSVSTRPVGHFIFPGEQQAPYAKETEPDQDFQRNLSLPKKNPSFNHMPFSSLIFHSWISDLKRSDMIPVEKVKKIMTLPRMDTGKQG